VVVLSWIISSDEPSATFGFCSLLSNSILAGKWSDNSERDWLQRLIRLQQRSLLYISLDRLSGMLN
jgi:hypothetical protein